MGPMNKAQLKVVPGSDSSKVTLKGVPSYRSPGWNLPELRPLKGSPEGGR
jgi:hypothetical protein